MRGVQYNNNNVLSVLETHRAASARTAIRATAWPYFGLLSPLVRGRRPSSKPGGGSPSPEEGTLHVTLLLERSLEACCWQAVLLAAQQHLVRQQYLSPGTRRYPIPGYCATTCPALVQHESSLPNCSASVGLELSAAADRPRHMSTLSSCWHHCHFELRSQRLASYGCSDLSCTILPPPRLSL